MQADGGHHLKSVEISSSWHPEKLLAVKAQQDNWMSLWWALQSFIRTQVDRQTKDRILILSRELNQ